MKVTYSFEVYSYEDGDGERDPLVVEETGVDREDVEMTPEEVAREVKGWESSEYPVPGEKPPHSFWFRATSPAMTRERIEQGRERYDSLHINECTPDEWRALVALL